MPDDLTRLAEDILRARGGNGRRPPSIPPSGGEIEDPLDFIAAQRVRAQLFGRHDVTVDHVRAAMEGRTRPASRGRVPDIVSVDNRDGTSSSERTISIEAAELNGGRITVIPTLVQGRQLTNDQAVRWAIQSGLRYPSFDTLEDADAFASARSAGGGAGAHGFLGREVTGRQNAPDATGFPPRSSVPPTVEAKTGGINTGISAQGVAPGVPGMGSIADLLTPTEPGIPQDAGDMARETGAAAPPVIRYDPNRPQPAEIDAEGMATINRQRGELLTRRNEEIKRQQAAVALPVPTEPVSASGQRLSEVVDPGFVERLLHPTKERIRTRWGVKTLIGEVQAGKMINAIVEAELQYRLKSGLYNQDEVTVQPFEDYLRARVPQFRDKLAADPVWQQFFGTQFVEADRLRKNIHDELMGGLPMYAPSNEQVQDDLYRKLVELEPNELPPAQGILDKIAEFGGELAPFLAEFAVLRRAVRPVGRRLARPPRASGGLARRAGGLAPPATAGEPLAAEAITGAMTGGGLAAAHGQDPGLAAATFGALPGAHAAARFLAPGVPAGLAKGVGTGVVFGGTTAVAGGNWEDVLISGVVAPLLFHIGDIMRFPFRPPGAKGTQADYSELFKGWAEKDAGRVKNQVQRFMSWRLGVTQGRSETTLPDGEALRDLGEAIQREAHRARVYPKRYTTEEHAILAGFAKHYDPQEVLSRQGVGSVSKPGVMRPQETVEGKTRATRDAEDAGRGEADVPAGDVGLPGRAGDVAPRIPEPPVRAEVTATTPAPPGPPQEGGVQAETRLRKPFTGQRYVVTKIQDAPPAWAVTDKAHDEVIQTLADESVAQSVRQEYQNIEDKQDRGDPLRGVGAEVPGAPPDAGGPQRVEIPEGRKSVRVAPVGDIPGFVISRMPNGSHFLRFKGKAGDVIKQRLSAAGIRWEPKPNVRAWISPARYDAQNITQIITGTLGDALPGPPQGGGIRPTERDVPFATNEVPADRPGPGGLRGLTPEDVTLLLRMPEGKDNRGFVTAALIRRGYRHRVPSTKYEYLVHPSGEWRYRLQTPNLRREILRDDVWTPVRERPHTYKALATEIRKRLGAIAPGPGLPSSPPVGGIQAGRTGATTPPVEARAQPPAPAHAPAPSTAPLAVEERAGVSATPPPPAAVPRETAPKVLPDKTLAGELTLGQALDKAVEQAKTEVRAAAGLPATLPPSEPAPAGPPAKKAPPSPPEGGAEPTWRITYVNRAFAPRKSHATIQAKSSKAAVDKWMRTINKNVLKGKKPLHVERVEPPKEPQGPPPGTKLAPDASKLAKAQQEPVNAQTAKIPPRTAAEISVVEEAARETDNPDVGLDVPGAAPDRLARQQAARAAEQRAIRSKLAREAQAVASPFKDVGWEKNDLATVETARQALRRLAETGIAKNTDPALFPAQKDIATYVRVRDQAEAVLRRTAIPVPVPNYPNATFYAGADTVKQVQALAAKAGKMKPRKFRPPVPGKPTPIRAPGEMAVPSVRSTPSFPMPGTHKGTELAMLDGLRRAVSREATRFRLDGVMVTDSEAVTTDGRRVWIQRGDFSKLTKGGPTLYGFGGSQGKSTIHVIAQGMAGGQAGGFSHEKAAFADYRRITPEISGERFPIQIEYTIGNLRQALAFADADHRGVAIVRNPDDTLGFMSVMPEVGEAEINIQPGGRVLGAADGDFLVEQLQWHWRDGDTSVSFDFPSSAEPLRTDGNSTTGVLMPMYMEVKGVTRLDVRKARKVAAPGLYPEDVDAAWSESIATPERAQKAGLTPAFLHGEKGEVFKSEAGEVHNLSSLPKRYKIEGLPAYDPIISLGFVRANGDFLPMADAWMDVVPTLSESMLKNTAGLRNYRESEEKHRGALARAINAIDLHQSIDAMPGAPAERKNAERLTRDVEIGFLNSLARSTGGGVRIPPTSTEITAMRALHLKGAREQIEQLRKEGKLGPATYPDPQHKEWTTDELAYIRSLSPEKPAFGIGAMSDIPDLRNWWQRTWDSTADRMINAPRGTIQQGIFTAVGRGVSHFYGLSEREKRAFRNIRGAGNLALDRANTVLKLVRAEVAAAAAGRLEEVKRIRRKLEEPEPEKLRDEDLAAVQSQVHRRLEDVIRGVRTSVERDPEGKQLGPIEYTAVHPTTEAERRIFKAYSDLATPMTDEILNNEWMHPHLAAFGLKNIKDIIALKRTGPGAYLRRLYTSKTEAATLQAPRGEEQRGRLLRMPFSIRTTAPRIRGGMWMPRRGDEALFTVIDRTGSGLPVIHQFFDEVQANAHFLELHKIRAREFGESAASKIQLLDPFSVDDLESSGVLEPIRNLEILIARSLVDQALNLETLKQFKMLADTVAVKDVLDPANKLGYVQIPNAPSFGPLASMWVPESLAYQLNRYEIIRHGYWSKLWHNWNYAFKFTKVVLSPSTWGRQFMGNTLFQLADGMSFITDAKWLLMAAREFADKGPNYERAVKEGIISGSFFASERRDFQQMTARNPTDFTLGVQQWIEAHPKVRKLQRKAGDAAVVLGRAYDLPEQVMKLASYLKKTQALGMSHEEATRLVQNAYPNYDEPGAIARWSRRSILGAPFVMFTDQAAKIGGRHMRDRPARMLAILSVPGLLALASHWMLQMSDEEAELLNQDPRRRSWWARYFQPWLPWRDSEGKPGWFDLRWIWPLASDADFVLPSGGLSIPFVLQQPFFTVAEEIKFNRDDFLGRELVPQDDPAALRLWKFALHAAEVAVTGPLPPLLHKRGGGSAERIYKAATGDGHESVSSAVLREVFGISVRDPWIPRARAYKLIKETLSQGDADKFAELLVLYNTVYRGEFDKLILPGPVIRSMMQDRVKEILPRGRRP